MTTERGISLGIGRGLPLDTFGYSSDSGVLRIQLQGLPVRAQSLAQLPSLAVDISQIEVERNALRIHAERSLEGRQRLGRLH